MLAAPAAAGAATTVISKNWGGYAVKSRSGAKFRKVAGTWIVRKPDCATRSPAYSAAWVGIGGFGQGARAVEQTGVDADCTSAGKRRFTAWYEMLPAPSRRISMTVHGGDRISASVTVKGTQTTVRMRNRTTGAAFSKTVTVPSPDRRSAEWIVEAPSSCDGGGSCSFLPLADFGTVPFSAATAATGQDAMQPISSSAFSVFKIFLRTAGTAPGTSDGAAPSALGPRGMGFSVAYRDDLPAPSGRAKRLPAGAH